MGVPWQKELRCFPHSLSLRELKAAQSWADPPGEEKADEMTASWPGRQTHHLISGWGFYEKLDKKSVEKYDIEFIQIN